MKVTLGGERLGSGNKMKVDLHGFERSTHDLGYLWRTTLSPGTLVPFMSIPSLPGDTFDIDLDCKILTHPTVGPLFGSFKVQLDIFQCPIRLYQGKLHNNALGIGLNMASVKLPMLKLRGTELTTDTVDVDNSQINPSCILRYLGIKGVSDLGNGVTGDDRFRTFNAVPFLSYWDIYKNYYANKVEEIGAVIHTPIESVDETINYIKINSVTLEEYPTKTKPPLVIKDGSWEISYTTTAPDLNSVIITYFSGFGIFNRSIYSMSLADTISDNGTDTIVGTFNSNVGFASNWSYVGENLLMTLPPKVATFPLSNLDDMRNELLMDVTNNDPDYGYIVNDSGLTPYTWVCNWVNDINPMLFTQEGLAVKTYQSDLFNNWISTEWIDGTGGISEITAIDTSGGSFTIDTLNLSRKVYNMLNRIAVSGGSYQDWLDAVYTHERYTVAESPIYQGGLIKELVFQEVVSNAASNQDEGQTQSLGTLSGRGVMGDKHKGGKVTIKVDEPSYIIGIISLTPRIDYSQGNKWDINLRTMDDFHKPSLDEIGFQELITEYAAWWTTKKASNGSPFVQKSAGKQPAWLNYMTAVNEVHGNFAMPDESFMVLTRRYEWDDATADIKDLTTYIDPTKFNHIFAQTSIDAMNFWTQIRVGCIARRKMSAKIMPNL